MLQRWRHGRRCRNLARQCSQTELAQYLESCSRLSIGNIAGTPLFAVDMELTGLEGKVAVVTGAGRLRSIGRSIALELARAGCDVAITGTGRDPATYPDDEKAVDWRDIESVAEEIRQLGRRALPVVSDVSDLSSVEALSDRVESELGPVDFVVNNAGAARGGDRVGIVEIDPATWRRVIDVNLNGSFYMSHVFGRRLIDRGEGVAIVNISSIGGQQGGPSRADGGDEW